MRVIAKVWEWLDQRLQLGPAIRETAEHPVPRETASWFYVFGSAALTCFILQIVTGILLALIYVPQPEKLGTACRFLIMVLPSVGLFEPCTAGARISWLRSS